MTSVTDQTVASPGHQSELTDIRAVLGGSEDVTLTNGTTRVVLPQEIRSVLCDAVTALSNGQAVTVTTLNETMTTQEAADFLGVSRPTLVKFLDEGRIPSTRPGQHRRVRLQDIISFRDELLQERRE